MTEFSVEKIVSGITLIFVAFMSWIAKEKFKKINYLAEHSITRREHDKDLERIWTEIKESRLETKSDVKGIHEKLDKMK